MLKLILFLVSFFYVSTVNAGNAYENQIYPEINKACPDFVLKNIRYYEKKQASLKDFEGKWLVLDFWNKQCGACVASFPKVNNLQKKFAGQVQFMFVGIPDKEGQIEPMYARFREEEGLIVPCAFDSFLARRFDIYAAPYIIVIDPGGIVRGVSYALDSSDMRGFLSGNPPRLHKAYRMNNDEEETIVKPFNKKQPFLIGGNGGGDSIFLFRSVLSAWDNFSQPGYFPQSIAQDSAQGRFQVLGVYLEMLYSYAYFGKPYPQKEFEQDPTLEISDQSIFHSSYAKSKNYFCYSLQMPVNICTRARIQSMLQKDLESYFGYVASIEERPFSVWRLVKTDKGKNKLKTHGGDTIFKSLLPKADFIAQNWPWRKLVDMLQGATSKKIVDETGITGNIDIQMNCVLLDIESIRRGLRKWGLDLVLGTEIHRGLVIRDKPVTY